MDKKPNNGSTYFYVTDEGKINEDKWFGSETDMNRLNFDNLFTERTEAHNRVKQIKEALSRPLSHSAA